MKTILLKWLPLILSLAICITTVAITVSVKSEPADNGKSAYEIAVMNGFEGTEEEWLASLKGEAGVQGEKGDKGDTGAQGEKGDKGDTGALGEKGDKGDAGAQGPKGDKGETGAQGPQGEKGDKGDPGDTNSTSGNNSTQPTPDEDVIEITLWVSTTTGVKEFTEDRIEAFKALHPEYNFNITIDSVGEGDAATEVLKDVATAPDMYCFAQDQITRLVQGGALTPLDTQTAQRVADENDVGSVNAATVDGNIYAYPMTNDNGIFLYYDSSKISDTEAQTLEGIIAACEREGVFFGYDLTNAWIAAGFFFAQPAGGGTPLCTSTWTYSEDAKNPIAVNDTFNSDNGLIAYKEMYDLAGSSAWYNYAYPFDDFGAVVSGIWDANTAEGAWGDDMRAVKLPTFTGSDGKSYQLGSYSGCKLVGCKPQTDATKAEICKELALFLTSEEEQLERYYEFMWGPSNLNAQNNVDVKSNHLLSALIDQNVYAQPQGVIPNDWWTEAAALGELCKTRDLTDDDLRAALATYEENINKLIVK